MSAETIRFNTDEETRRGYVISREMKKVWAVQIELLTRLFEVCKKHNLRIWADGGTLIGVIREHGYIPWDDDIDMCMPRDDYDKLLSIAAEEFQEPYYLQSAHTDDKYPRGHAQLRKSGTSAILWKDVWSDFHQGIFIDIFVLDAIPDSPEGKRLLVEQAMPILDALYVYSKKYSFWRFFSHPVTYIRNHMSNKRIARKGFHNVFAEYEDYFRRNRIEDNKYMQTITIESDKKLSLALPKELYSETLYMPFENIMMPVPIGYDKVLTTMYGDYMTPAKTPTLHGEFFYLDTERSYADVLPSLRLKYKKEKRKRKWKHIFDKARRVVGLAPR